ncbi:MAG: hypothetical protein QXK88_05435 [Desulfurococcaceae archaeon]
MGFSGKLIGLLMITLMSSVAAITYLGATLLSIAGLAVYAICILLLAIYIDRYSDLRDATSAFTLAATVTALGAVIGSILAFRAYSTLIAIGVVVTSIIYTLFAMRVSPR